MWIFIVYELFSAECAATDRVLVLLSDVSTRRRETLALREYDENHLGDSSVRYIKTTSCSLSGFYILFWFSRPGNHENSLETWDRPRSGHLIKNLCDFQAKLSSTGGHAQWSKISEFSSFLPSLKHFSWKLFRSLARWLHLLHLLVAIRNHGKSKKCSAFDLRR